MKYPLIVCTAGFSVCQSWMNFWAENYGEMVVYNGEDCTPSSSDYVGGHAVKIVGYLLLIIV